MPTNAPTPPFTLLGVPSDADSLTGSDVDDATDDPADDAAVGDIVESETSDRADAGDSASDNGSGGGTGADDPERREDEAVDTESPSAAADDNDLDGLASPFGDDLRLPDEHGYDGTDYLDDDFIEDEYGEEVLFDGDPDEFELHFGGQAAYPSARPQAGDVLVLDDASAQRGPPPPRRMSRMERRRRMRLQARRVRRIIRHVEPWSVLKISIFFYASLWVIFLVAGFMIWGVAESSGTVDKIESLVLELFALDTFDFDAGQIFRGYALGGLALSIAGTTFNVLMCLLFNLISDLTGGLRITMIEEESARPIPPRRRRRRRPPARR